MDMEDVYTIICDFSASILTNCRNLRPQLLLEQSRSFLRENRTSELDRDKIQTGETCLQMQQ